MAFRDSLQRDSGAFFQLGGGKLAWHTLDPFLWLCEPPKHPNPFRKSLYGMVPSGEAACQSWTLVSLKFPLRMVGPLWGPMEEL